MKMKIIALLLVLNMTVMLFADESDDSNESAKRKPDTGFDWNIRAGVSFPFIPVGSGFSELGQIGGSEIAFIGYTLVTLALSSVSLGGGIQTTIIPHFLAPGIYFDIHFNLLSWGLIYAFSNMNMVLLQSGFRIYNQFKFNDNISLEPFFGVNFVFTVLDGNRFPFPLLAAGFIFNIRNFGIEYGYNFFPKKDGEDIPFSAIHRITLWWKLNRRR